MFILLSFQFLLNHSHKRRFWSNETPISLTTVVLDILGALESGVFLKKDSGKCMILNFICSCHSSYIYKYLKNQIKP